MGAAEGRILGHEFAVTTSDGTAVAIEPTVGCGACRYCVVGERMDCEGERSFMGIKADGGMAEQLIVDPLMLVALPSGLDLGIAVLVEPRRRPGGSELAERPDIADVMVTHRFPLESGRGFRNSGRSGS